VELLDFFVAGPELAIRSELPFVPGFEPMSPHCLGFAILHPREGRLGTAQAEWIENRIEVGLSWKCGAETQASSELEVFRLLAGVCRKLAPVEILIRDPGPESAGAHDALPEHGFRRNQAGRWFLPANLVAPATAKADSMEALYSDPFRVTWNFEPRPWTLLATFLARLSNTPSARVLDLGCGFGKNSVLLEALGFETHGADVADGAIKICRRWVREADRFQAASIDALPFEADSFDAILDIGCLHCLPAGLVEPGIAEIARILRPGGSLTLRALRPRPPEWLAHQAYHVEALGFSPQQLLAVLTPRFRVQVSEDHETIGVHAALR